MVLENDGDQMDQSTKKERSITESQGGQEYPAYNKPKAG